MTPDAAWPALPNYARFSDADHAAHTSPKGIPYPEDLGMHKNAAKATKQLLKITKPHLKTKTLNRRKRRKQR